MTAEIAIMNKTAVALAADSAVTIRQKEGQNPKIFQTNKLFALSKHHPVGIMVYGSAEFMGVPWETIIKVYRKKLKDNEFSKLKDYANDFIKYLDSEDKLIPVTEQEKYFNSSILGYFSLIKKEINESVDSIIKNEGKIDDLKINEIIISVIDKHYDKLNKAEKLSNISNDDVINIKNKYGQYINVAIKEVFQELPIPEE